MRVKIVLLARKKSKAQGHEFLFWDDAGLVTLPQQDFRIWQESYNFSTLLGRLEISNPRAETEFRFHQLHTGTIKETFTLAIDLDRPPSQALAHPESGQLWLTFPEVLDRSRRGLLYFTCHRMIIETFLREFPR